MVPLIIIALAAASQIPTLDIPAGCRPETAMQDQTTDYQDCMKDEQATQERLAKEWASYPAAAKSECTRNPSTLINSYVELLVCIEMQTWKSDPAAMSAQGVVVGGARGGSPPLPAQMGGAGASHPLGGPPNVHVP
jgi:hypothetical protein